MAYNRRYRSNSSAAQRSNPVVTGAAAFIAISVASICGFQLDAKSSSASVSSVIHEDGRASLKLSPSEGEAIPPIVARVMEASGVSGRTVFGAGWTPTSPVVVEGVELSPYLSGAQILTRSMTPGVQIEQVTLSALFERKDSVFDFVIGLEEEPQRIVRFDAKGVEVLLRSPGGLEQSLANADRTSCPLYTVKIAAGELTVSCEDSSLLTTVMPSNTQHQITVATNLTRSQVRSFKINGKADETPFEEGF